MRLVLMILASALALWGCSGVNTSINTLQFSAAAEPFPVDYQSRALRYLSDRGPVGVQVSYPQTLLGETVFSPQRWYVCLIGLPPPAASGVGARAAARDMKPVTYSGIYHEVLVLRANGTASAIRGFDSPLCASGRYEGLSVG